MKIRPHVVLIVLLAASLFVLAVGLARGQDAPEAVEPRNPMTSDWLEVGYAFDSRHTRLLSFEGHASPSEELDAWGQLDLESSLDQDLSRWRGRFGLFGRCDAKAGVALWYEDFNGSWNETARVGAYFDPSLGGPHPFCRLMLLPLSTEDGGVMGRAMFDVALRERWSLSGFVERDWFADGGDFTAAEPELRYEIRKGVWAALEYRRDERQDDVEGLALGLKAAL